ncbi:MAG: nucleotidyltransferase family protein [Candidatus Omnitrophota bacterium]
MTKSNKTMKALMLAAGYATRLWPLTLDKPKPLLPIKGKPIMEYSVDKIAKIPDIGAVYVVTNSKFVKSFQGWANGYKTDKKILVIDDEMKTVDQRRGAIGDILYSIENKKIKDDLLIIAGDNLFNFSIKDFMAFAVSHKPYATIGAFDVKDFELAKNYGIIKIDKNAKIINFIEKPKDPPSTLAAMCLYFIPAEKLSLIKEYKSQGSPLDLAGNFIKWLSEKESVYGYVFTGTWMDIGDKETLKYAQENYKEEQ